MSVDMNPADEDPHGECGHEIRRLQLVLAQEIAIVDSVWKALGVSTFAEAKGKSIDQLVSKLVLNSDRRSVKAEAFTEALAEAERIQKIMGGDWRYAAESFADWLREKIAEL